MHNKKVQKDSLIQNLSFLFFFGKISKIELCMVLIHEKGKIEKLKMDAL